MLIIFFSHSTKLYQEALNPRDEPRAEQQSAPGLCPAGA